MYINGTQVALFTDSDYVKTAGWGFMTLGTVDYDDIVVSDSFGGITPTFTPTISPTFTVTPTLTRTPTPLPPKSGVVADPPQTKVNSCSLGVWVVP